VDGEERATLVKAVADFVSSHLDPLLKRLQLANTRRVWRDLVQRAEKEEWSYEVLLHTLFAVVDEVGYLAYGDDAANVLYHVVNDRHIRRRAMIFATNKHPRRWGAVLHDDDLADAIVDRILERAGSFVSTAPPSARSTCPTATYDSTIKTLPGVAESPEEWPQSRTREASPSEAERSAVLTEPRSLSEGSALRNGVTDGA
jgi:hypothetical protein